MILRDKISLGKTDINWERLEEWSDKMNEMMVVLGVIWIIIALIWTFMQSLS